MYIENIWQTHKFTVIRVRNLLKIFTTDKRLISLVFDYNVNVIHFCQVSSVKL